MFQSVSVSLLFTRRGDQLPVHQYETLGDPPEMSFRYFYSCRGSFARRLKESSSICPSRQKVYGSGATGIRVHESPELGVGNSNSVSQGCRLRVIVIKRNRSMYLEKIP